MKVHISNWLHRLADWLDPHYCECYLRGMQSSWKRTRLPLTAADEADAWLRHRQVIAEGETWTWSA